jgi:ariadne-1
LVDKTALEKYNASITDSFVEDNPMLKWCPSAPHCGHAGPFISSFFDFAVKLIYGYGKTVDVLCNCGFLFCFGCGKEAHLPCSCDMKKKVHRNTCSE